MITLYYVEGLSRVNQPCFDSIDEQLQFFDHCSVDTLSEGFYPPHYKNEIVVSNDDLDFRTKCNYLSILYNDKYYYYFIDNIEYISEDVIKLYITMDVIQTYMFDMKFIDVGISRLSIPRWIKEGNDYVINRNYIRENLSKGKFKNYSYTHDLDDISWYIIWIRDPGNMYVKVNDITYVPITTNNAMGLSSPTDEVSRVAYVYATPLLIPISNDANYPTVFVNGYVSYYDFRDIVAQPNVIRITKVDHDICQGSYTATYKNKAIYLDFSLSPTNSVENLVVKTADDTYTVVNPVVRFDSTINKLPYNSRRISLDNEVPDCTVNNSVGIEFDPKYVPAMYDENYLHVEYGEQMSTGAYPVHQLTSPAIWYTKLIDWLSGNRIYTLSNQEYLGSFDDVYTVVNICNTQEYVDLYNDAWLQYYSQNSATWTMGYSLNKQKILYSALMGSFQTGMETAGNIIGSKSQGSAIGSAMHGISKQVGIIGGSIEDRYVLDEERKITQSNLEATPDTEKQGNTLTTDTFVLATREVLKVDVVEDYNNVARIIERVGYGVNDRVYNTNLFELAHNRYYYDCITADIYSMTLTGVISDETTILNIKNRFSSGLRLWHTSNAGLLASYIGNYTYDNVEIAFIS